MGQLKIKTLLNKGDFRSEIPKIIILMEDLTSLKLNTEQPLSITVRKLNYDERPLRQYIL